MDIPLLTKVPALCVLLVAEHISFVPPRNSVSQADDSAKYGGRDLITRIVQWYPYVSAWCSMLLLVCEIAAILAHEYPSSLSSDLLSTLFKDSSSVNRLQPTVAWGVGFALLTLGSALRKVCYMTLGRMFTFQLAVVKEHKLITSGPYAVVRHPAYTGFFMATTGLLMVQLVPGTYLAESGIFDRRWTKVVAGAWVIWVLLLQLSVVKRIAKEDEVLRKEFGKEWDEWARRTPYRLVPYVY